MNNTQISGTTSAHTKSIIADPRWYQPLSTSRFRLRTPSEADLPFFMRCFSNDEFMNDFHRSAPRHRSADAVSGILKSSVHFVAQSRAAHWVIEELCGVPGRENDRPSGVRPIGLASLVDIMVAHKRAELLVGILKKSDRGHGAAIVSTLLLFDLAFNQIGLHKLITIVLADNSLSQRTCLSLGFFQEGLRKEHLFDHHSCSWQDCFENGLLVESFRENMKLARLSRRLLQRDITGPTRL